MINHLFDTCVVPRQAHQTCQVDDVLKVIIESRPFVVNHVLTHLCDVDLDGMALAFLWITIPVQALLILKNGTVCITNPCNLYQEMLKLVILKEQFTDVILITEDSLAVTTTQGAQKYNESVIFLTV